METYKQAPVIGSTRVDESAAGTHAKVYFTRVIDAAHLISLYSKINDAIYGKVAIKLHTGEKHGRTSCRETWWKPFRSRWQAARS